jgi:hypothetical protein
MADPSTMDDGGYPIERCTGENSVASAAKLAHHSDSHGFEAVRAHVMRNKARLNCPDSVLPATWGREQEASDHLKNKMRGK